jgi:hypothetical protein
MNIRPHGRRRLAALARPPLTDEEEKAMKFEAWKTALINEIKAAAEWRAEKGLADPNDPRIAKSQKALFAMRRWRRMRCPGWRPRTSSSPKCTIASRSPS